MNQETKHTDEGIVNFEEVELKEFVKLATDNNRSYIRMYPDRDNAQIRMYINLADLGEDGEWIRTTLEGVRMRFFGNVVLKKINLHSFDADNLITFLTAMKWERTDMRIEFRYDPENDSPMIEEAGLHNEMIYLKYKTASGNENTFHLNSPYAVGDQMNAVVMKQN